MSHFERVHTITDYYDGPRGGIADYEGRPHLYESIFDDAAGEYTDIFRLSPVSEDLFELALEDWQIWSRWETAFHNGTTSKDTHPALPADRQRHQELDAILKDRLLIDDSSCFTALGEFRVRDDPDWSGRGLRPLEVKWSATTVRDDNITYGFQAEVTLHQPDGCGVGDHPRGEGYSPHFAVPSCPHPVAVRFMNFSGCYAEPSKVTVTLYHGLGPDKLTITPGESFEIIMGAETVGTGRILTGLAKYERGENHSSG